MRIQSEPGFVLHVTPYRDTSLLVDLFTCNHGRVRCVAKGFRKPGKKGSSRALFPYTEYLFNWQGRGELKNLNRADIAATPALLTQQALFVGLYLNEILYRLLQEQDAYEALYQLYRQLMIELAQKGVDESALRRFELSLLQQLGYGLVLDSDAERGVPLRSDAYYRYIPEQGLQEIQGQRAEDLGGALMGAELMAIARDDFSRDETIKTAKRLTRGVIDFYLNGRQLHSRELYRQFLQDGTT
jgi:DNA repair protein RecO (recombination protein O)